MTSLCNEKRIRLDPKETMEYLKISYPTLMRLVRGNQVPHFRIGKGRNARVFFFQDSLDKWMQNLEKQPEAI
ncbi:MAG: helix-turn-helix domain-containing protein [Clostridiaceae bacterium]|nr:helix-turn-helix domain-containing protein [Clostridiaceae bacterium]